jgi:hypothetical protein
MWLTLPQVVRDRPIPMKSKGITCAQTCGRVFCPKTEMHLLKCSSFAAKLCALGRGFLIGDTPPPYVSSKGKKDKEEERPLRITYISAAPTRDNSP